jgi:hypothetical protein
VQTVSKIAGKAIVGETKTAAGRRVVALDDNLVTVLCEHRKAHAELRLLNSALVPLRGRFHHPNRPIAPC